ncbi:MAG TPA: hypothetical protein VFL64_20820 [Rhizobacter sp.]|nr:hypothetical protein [Rhizobacter sp.]
MSAAALAIQATGLVTPVGPTAPLSCAAFRAKLTNPTPTRFLDSDGLPIMAHQVELDMPWRGIPKLARMAAMSIEEALQAVPREEWGQLPLLLCVAERERVGRIAGLDDALYAEIEQLLGVRFATGSMVVPHGRVGVAVALSQARVLLGGPKPPPRVLVASADSLLVWPTLDHFDLAGRLLAAHNSNGFIPGEAAGALLVARPTPGASELLCSGIGFAREPAHIDSEAPLRADGLSEAIRASLGDAHCEMHDMDFRITDLSGEQYYFKEATLALSRTLRRLKDEFDIWHPAECTGEAGASAGTTVISLAREACRKGYARGHRILAHWSNDGGQRAAVTLHYQGGT